MVQKAHSNSGADVSRAPLDAVTLKAQFTTMDEVLKRRPVSAEAMNKARRRNRAFVFGNSLMAIRKARGVSQVQLASTLEVSQNRVSQIERGQIDKTQLDTLMRYVEALGGKLTVSAQIADETIVLAQSQPLTESPVTWSQLVNSKG
jgi:predicted XRE-type DNA-binding protein